MLKKIAFFFLIIISTSIKAQTPLPQSDVFKLHVKKIDPNTVQLQWTIHPGYSLYKNRIKFLKLKNTELGHYSLPKSAVKIDTTGKTYQVYKKSFQIALPLLNDIKKQASMIVEYQGCADSGFCYPPSKRKLILNLNKEGGIIDVKLAPLGVKQPTIVKAKQQKEIDSLFQQSHFPLLLLSFYGFGLLLAFTPCVLPMVPVLSGLIVGLGHKISTKQAFLLSLSYVLAMSASYALVGVFVAILGSNIQLMLQTPWVITAFALVFVVLALSMFGFYELRLPQAMQAKLSEASKKQKNGAYWGAAMMGALSTLILSPCITAPLVGALGYIANTGDIILGGSALFFLGLGMGTPLLLIGTSAKTLLPKTGAWMNNVKYFFGVLLLSVAIYLLTKILPGYIGLVLWASLLIICACYVGALPQNKHSPWRKFWQGIGLMLLFYGALLLIGAAMGNSDPIHPLANLNAKAHQSTSASYTRVTSIEQVEQARKLAIKHGQPVLLDFYADWCLACTLMEKTVFSSPNVKKAMQHMRWLKADITAQTAEQKALMTSFSVFAPPTFIFFDAKGKQRTDIRLTGEVNQRTFLTHLQAVQQISPLLASE